MRFYAGWKLASRNKPSEQTDFFGWRYKAGLPHLAGMEAVDVALCLAVDCSASVDYDEFGLMMGGLAQAFREPDIAAAVAAGPRGAVAVSLLFWSGLREQAVALDWARLDGEAASQALADAIDATPRLMAGSTTALGAGMAAGLGLLGRCPGEATRLVLDVSGDGRNNSGRAPGPARDVAVAAGVTVNALAVLNEEPDLLDYYRAEVIGGAGSFAMACADYADFAEAIRQKLLREMRGALLA
jgi:hypothetical protein